MHKPQLIQCSPIVAVGAPGPIPMQIAFSEKGTVDLSKLCARVQETGGLANGRINLLGVCDVVVIALNGSELYQRGRNAGTGIAKAFDPTRKGSFTNLPTIDVSSSDTLAVTFDFTNYAGAAVVAQCSVAMTPVRKLAYEDQRFPNGGIGGEVIQGAPLAAVAGAGVGVPFAITVDTPGIVDLSRLVVMMFQAPAVGVSPIDSTELQDSSSVLALSVRNDYQIITGQNGPVAAPSGLFSPNRSKNFAHLGLHQVTPGDAINITLAQNTGAGAFATAQVPLYPFADGKGGASTRGGACPC